VVGKAEGKIPLCRYWRRLVANIKMDLKEIGWEIVDWILLDQRRKPRNEHCGFITCWEIVG
jgi:hypothetical protein